MAGVFRRRWFPRRKGSFGLSAVNATVNLDGLESSSAVGSFDYAAMNEQIGVFATAEVNSPTASIDDALVGVEATTEIGALIMAHSISSAIGQQATAEVGTTDTFNVSHTLSGIAATSQFQTFTLELATDIDLVGVSATAQINTTASMTRDVELVGQFAVAGGFFANQTGAGGGGGGAAGYFGPGQMGVNGFPGSGGGTGGAADNGLIPGATVPGTSGNDGDELDASHGSGSGGAGASFDSNVGASTYNYNGTIFITYISSVDGELQWVALDTDSTSPYTIPADWSDTNTITLSGAGCATPGEVLSVVDVPGYIAGQLITFECASYCSPDPTTFDIFEAESGLATNNLTEGRGGDGGLYGGGGGGGTGGGGGRGGDGLIWIEYQSTDDNVTMKTVIFNVADNSDSPWLVPSDWSHVNYIELLGSGGHGGVGDPLHGGNGGGGAGVVAAFDVQAFAPGESIYYFVSPGGSNLPTILGNFASESGENGDSETEPPAIWDHFVATLPGTNNGISFPRGPRSLGYGIGGRGGSLTGFPFSGDSEESPGVEAVAEVGSTITTAPGPRTFIIAGIKQSAIGPGVTMFPSSEEVNLDNDPYVIGSSQFYTIGQVHWDGDAREEGVDWEFVAPFNHIIRLLVDTSTITTPVTLIYYRWDIRVRSGFRVTDYPVPFAFTGTSIIAERVPPVDSFFTVSYTSYRPGINPSTMFSRHPLIVDDILSIHTLYDGDSGFESYRPAGYRVFDLDDNTLYTWDGTEWGSSGTLADGTLFYVKRLRGIYEYNGVTANLVFEAGDTIDHTYPETIEYPPFGESIGMNLLQDAFSPNAAVDFPAAYEISLKPGVYDEWLDI